MGMDIYGLNPKLLSPKPEIVWETASDEAKSEYFKIIEEWEEENPGYYFRANIWSWRPIQIAISLVNTHYKLGLDISGFDENSGQGLKTQEDCDLLAQYLEKYLSILELKDGETMYISMGIWVDENGKFLSSEEEEKLNLQFKQGESFYSSIVTEDGKLVRPSHAIRYNHFKEFITFLRHCGGFEIW
jgi:hypothetical protein